MPSILKWYGREVSLQLRGKVAANVQKAADHLVTVAKQEAPVRKGILRNSIDRTESENPLRAYIGVGAPYARYVHDGTSRQAANPFMLRAITRAWARMRQLLNST